MNRHALKLSFLLITLATAAQAADPAGTVDNSKKFYTRQSETGSTVLGNGDAEAGSTALHVQAPAVVGGDNTAGRVPAGRPGTAAAVAGASGVAPTVNYTSNAVTDDLKKRDEKLATRVAQMFHRRSAFNPGKGAAAAN